MLFQIAACFPVTIRGYVDAPDFYQYKTAYCRADWRGVGHLPIDPVKHQQSITEGLANGSLTLEEVIAEKGGDLEEHLDQLQEEKQLKEARGLSMQPVAQQDNAAANDSEDDSELAEPGDETEAELQALFQEMQ